MPRNKAVRANNTWALAVFSAVVALLPVTSAPQGLPFPALVRQRAVLGGITGPLSSVTVPDAEGLGFYVRDRAALRVLGKALFWDQQLGSDGNACASCHFHAGADNRSRNQLNPGLKNESAAFPTGDLLFGNTPFQGVASPSQFRPNYQLTAQDFPFTRRADPRDRTSAILSDTNDVVSSQGVLNATYLGSALPFDLGDPLFWIFQQGGVLVRNVEPRNTPSTINAVFNHRNFWDGRARAIFNGVNPFGDLDTNATVVMVDPASGNASFVAMQIGTASLASQSVGPPLSDIEMAFHGIRFADIGRKLLADETVVLAYQRVAPDDSLLGPYSLRGSGSAPGTTLRYRALIEQAFATRWWDARGWRVTVVNGTPQLIQSDAVDASTFTVLEFNFPLFFGLALAEYQRTLVSDQTPFDAFMAGDDAALTQQELAGLDLFVDPVLGRCVACHGGPELTTASVRLAGANPLARMVLGDGRVGAYDEGFYNIGVRPSGEDLSVGGQVLGLDLSNAQRLSACVSARVAEGQTLEQANATCNVPRVLAIPAEAYALLLQAAAIVGNPPDVVALLDQAEDLLEEPVAVGNPPPDLVAASVPLRQAHDLLVPYSAAFPQIAALLSDATLLLADPSATILPDPLPPIPEPPPPGTRYAPYGPLLAPNERTVANGAFKTPSLRNVELTAPYFHNGGQATLEQVVAFYNRGGDFGLLNPEDLDVDILPLGLTDQQQASIVAFLKALTDERVRWDRAPFDHPSLDVPNGGTAGRLVYTFFPGVGVLDDRVHLPETGAGGSSVRLGTTTTPFANFLQPLVPNVFPAATGVTLTPTLASPQPVGTSVTFSAQGSGSAGGYEYRFWLYRDGAWEVVQEYGVASTWTLPASTPAGSYDLSVHVRTRDNVEYDAVLDPALAFRIISSGAGPATGVTLTPELPSPQTSGTAVTFVARGEGSVEPYQYRFWLYINGAWELVQDYSAGASWTMPSSLPAGNYAVSVHVRTSPEVEYDAVLDPALTYRLSTSAVAPATGVTLTPSVTSPQRTGTEVTFTALGQGSTGPFQYRFWLYRNGAWEVVQHYGVGSSWTMPASMSAGTYHVSVHVRTTNDVDHDAVLDPALTYQIISSGVSPATGVALTSDLASPQLAGTPVTFTAVGDGSTGPYEYRFWLYRDGVWEIVQDYGIASTWEMPADLPSGTYDVSVHVRTDPAGPAEAALNPSLTYVLD